MQQQNVQSVIWSTCVKKKKELFGQLDYCITDDGVSCWVEMRINKINPGQRVPSGANCVYLILNLKLPALFVHIEMKVHTPQPQQHYKKEIELAAGIYNNCPHMSIPLI